MDDDDCLHGLDPRWCSICLHGVKREQPYRPETHQRGPRAGDHITMRAKFDSRCSKCGGEISAGDTISLESTDDDQRWVCC